MNKILNILRMFGIKPQQFVNMVLTWLPGELAQVALILALQRASPEARRRMGVSLTKAGNALQEGKLEEGAEALSEVLHEIKI